MSALANQIDTIGLPSPGLPSRNVPVPGLGLTNGGLRVSNFTAIANTYYAVEATGVTVTGPASAQIGDTLTIAVGASTVMFSPGVLKVNGQTGSTPLLPYNTYIITYTGATSGWC